MKRIQKISILTLLFLFTVFTEVKADEIVCVECHLSLEIPLYTKIVHDWQGSIHNKMGVKCNDCHGGDPNDFAMAMDPSTGYKGKPATKDIPAFCGKCHIGIFENFKNSAHQTALMEGNGPTCITCHNNHDVQKVTSNIINEKSCGKSECHSYDKAKRVKQSFSSAEFEIKKIKEIIPVLENDDIKTSDIKEKLFSTQQSLHSMTHVLSLDKIKKMNHETIKELKKINEDLAILSEEHQHRKVIGTIVILFCFAGLIILLKYRSILKSYRN
ncbi:MAG: hypothetical protein HQK84_06880 [Nitrospinae bacterium]|nr:hypothetical protein [Nitrospinota bacterium]